MTFKESAASRETSQEIIDAIDGIARDDAEAVRIWEMPSDPEMVHIWRAVTRNGLLDDYSFIWGASGDRWAETCDLDYSA
jgi:hypothetical protein